MLKKLLVVVVVAGAGLAAWFVLGERNKSTTPNLTATTLPSMPVTAYFYRGGGLVPVVVRVPKTAAVATAALEALLGGKPRGLSTAIPAGTELNDVTVSAGLATADFSQELAGAPRTAQAQIVYTLTQFPTVKGVLIDAAGSPVALSDGPGSTAHTPVSRDAYVDLTSDAPIFVETPKRDATVSSPVDVSGTAQVFEATFALEVWAGTKLLETDTITATAGAPDRGTFAKTLDLAPGDYRLVFYEPSAENGAHLHETTVDITVTP